jgi:chromosome segregation ATPase
MANTTEATTEAHEDVARIVEELRPRVSELESALIGHVGSDPVESSSHAPASEDTSNVIATINNLHREIEAARAEKGSLGADLAAVQNRLTAEQAAGAELAARVEELEVRANVAGQLREELAFVKRELDENARRLKEALAHLDSVSQERNRLAEQKDRAERRSAKTEGDLRDLAAKVARLEEAAAGLGRLRRELSETTAALAEVRESSQRQKERAQRLKDELDAKEIARHALELDLSTTRELGCRQNERIGELEENLATAHAQLTDLRAKLEKQEPENAHLTQANERAGHELKTLKVRVDSMKQELDVTAQALREIGATAVRTTNRIREHGSEA